jgi:hypothetical protein
MDQHASTSTDSFSDSTGSTATEHDVDSEGTSEGAKASRRNSLKSGMTATEVFPEQLEMAIGKIQGELADHYQPSPGIECRLIREMAVNWAKLEYAEELRKLDVVRVKRRANLSWDSDQRAIAERRARKLRDTPERVVPVLERSKQGALLLLESWTGLHEALLTNGALDAAQHRSMYDLLGVSLELRNGSRRVPAAQDGPALSVLVTAQMDRLRGLLEESLDALDEEHRLLAVAGMPYAADAETQKLKRYETTARNNLNRARAEFRQARAEAEAAEQRRRRKQAEQFEEELDEMASRPAPAQPASPPPPPPPAPTMRPFFVTMDDRESDSIAAERLEMGRQRLNRKPFEEPARKSADRRAGKAGR